MRAVVLVGGFGTRLRPLTLTTPKPMLPIGNRPMIARLVDRLGRGGVTEVVLALGFKPEPFMAAFPDGRCGDVKLTYAVEPEPLDTGGAIKFAAESAGIDDTFVVANGDVMTDLDVGALVTAHQELGAEATVHLISVAEPSAFGVAELGDDGRIRSFIEKPAPGTEPSNLINAGTYVFEPSVLDRIAPGQRVSIERVTFPEVTAAGGLYGYATEDYWIDAGVPDLYRTANLDLLGDARIHDRCDPVASTAVVADSATVNNSIIGPDVVIGAGAHIVDSVMIEGCVVGAGGRVERSLVMGTLGARSTTVDSMVGAHGVLEAGASLSDGTLPSTVDA